MRAGVASALCVGFAQDMAPSANATALMTEHLACECMVADIYMHCVYIGYSECVDLHCMYGAILYAKSYTNCI